MPDELSLLGVDFRSLPVAALHVVGGRVQAANPAYLALTRSGPEAVVGRAVAELVPGAGEAPGEGERWGQLTDAAGARRAVQVLWRPAPGPDAQLLLLLPADGDGDGEARRLAERLTAAAVGLLGLPDEGAVLERAAEALAGDGYTVTFLLLREGDPLLAYGPHRSPQPPGGVPFAAVRPPREVLSRFNPRFHERRAAFFQQPAELVRAAYPAELAGRLAGALPGRRSVQAPLFVAGQPYGALVVTDDRLTPLSVGALELYAQLVGAALENVRLHQRAADRLAELERLQRELVARERLAAVGEAAAVMAHEVRNPLGAILNAVALLGRGGAGPALHRVIAEEAGRLDRLVGDLLALGRPLLPRPGHADLARVAERAGDVLRSRGELQGRALDPAVTDGALAVADSDLAELALLNLLRNALQASPPGGHVRVRVRGEGGLVALSVEDDGPGVSPQVAARMFEPFFTTRATGTGIGLALVRRVMDASRGSVEVGRSESGGTRVTLRFPAA